MKNKNSTTSEMAIDVAELAKRLGINLNSAYALTKRPDFPAVRVSPRRIVIPIAGLEKWLNEQCGAV